MATKNTKKILVKEYAKTVNQNISTIKKVFGDLEIDYKPFIGTYQQILTKSSSIVAGKWEEEKKHVRTEFVKRAFGRKYPNEVVLLSLLVDAMINILDDFFDEDLDKEAKKLYLVEYLRAFAVYSKIGLSKKLEKRMSLYFNKLIMLAMAEQMILKKIESLKELKVIVDLASKLLTSRSQDIDIFVEIAAEKQKISKKEALNLQNMSRLFRAVNIFRKDILDIDHDLKNKQFTVVTEMHKRGASTYTSFIKELLDYFIEKGNDLKKGSKFRPVARFHDMLKHESSLILKGLD